jgi:Berberine and berberine like
MRDGPEELAPVGVLGRVPPAEPFPEEIHHAPFVAILAPYLGTPAEGEAATEPLRRFAEPLADLSGAMPWVVAQSVLDEDYPDGGRYYWKSANVPELSAAAIDTMVEHAERAPSDHSTVDVWFNGGAMGRVPEQATAFGNRASPYLIGVEANWEEPAGDAENLAWVRALLADLEQHGTGGVYLNFAGTREEATSLAAEGHGANYERLALLKGIYDPDNVFRHNPNVPPVA